eukprot:TRINITY_DN3327_c0_g1_i3.p2 TRINITY_DN3327_c0_g1~~TRINITY_DN3327_c0_g1_i3.p2  ORF type:complete len:198 (+),score=-32.45 TRINITY_DN3327_c0_g1_i3:252-845(+)
MYIINYINCTVLQSINNVLYQYKQISQMERQNNQQNISHQYHTLFFCKFIQTKIIFKQLPKYCHVCLIQYNYKHLLKFNKCLYSTSQTHVHILLKDDCPLFFGFYFSCYGFYFFLKSNQCYNLPSHQTQRYNRDESINNHNQYHNLQSIPITIITNNIFQINLSFKSQRRIQFICIQSFYSIKLCLAKKSVVVLYRH